MVENRLYILPAAQNSSVLWRGSSPDTFDVRAVLHLCVLLCRFAAMPSLPTFHWIFPENYATIDTISGKNPRTMTA